MSKKNMSKNWQPVLIISILLLSLIISVPGYPADESVLFTSVPPDALIAVDFSLSMMWTQYGETLYYKRSAAGCPATQPACDSSLSTTPANTFYGNYNATTAPCPCTAAMSGGPRYAAITDTSCTGPFNFDSARLDCSRAAIAKRAIFAMLDDNNNGSIISTGANSDDISLNIRMGYMNFVNCGSSDDTGGNYSSGCIALANEIGSRYSQIYCGNSSSCTTWSGTGGLRGTNPDGYTPLASMLREAKIYLDAHKATDTAAACRDKFVILLTDGSDTISCQTNSGIEWDAIQYKRRRATVDRAKALAAAGYKVFIIGFGSDLPDFLKNTLNWAAYHGGTDNPLIPNTGNVSAYTPYDAPSSVANPTACSTTTTTTCYKYECSTVSGLTTGLTCPTPTLTGCTAGSPNCYCPANFNDPGGFPVISGGVLNYTGALNGYAFIATNVNELNTALKQAVNIIRQATYSFTLTSISTARITSENHLYEASFTPIDDEPFWQGHLKKYAINPNGSIGGALWNAGSVLDSTSASARNIKTYKSGLIMDFTTVNIGPVDLGLVNTNTTRRDEIVGYIRGETDYNRDNWKLGDIWHSSPVVITSPSPFFKDVIDLNNTFETFRTNNQRTSENGKRAVIAGANDGQLHVFRTSDGQETFSFIPPNMLPKLQLIAHATHPTLLTHQFFVDGPISAADAWLGSGSGTSKSASDWKTIVVFGLGRGANDYSGGTLLRPYLWSNKSDCTPDITLSNNGYSSIYTAAHTNYCGYYAFDATTNPSTPQYMWRINPSSSEAQYLGDPWSRMSLGKVKINGNEKWVGFIGGGGYEYSCSGGNPPDPGNRTKGFFVVDLSNGNILWRYTKASNLLMNYAIPTPPAIVDADNDGFIDTVYTGDLGGNMWRFKFCTKQDANSCGTANWSGGLFYDSSSGQIRPIYTGATIAKDTAGNMWVYWGTGDKQCPADSNAQEHFYALKDNDRTTKYTISNIDNLTSPSQTYDGEKNGWRIQLAGNGEKILAEPTVFGGVVYFTTFTPASGNNPCQMGGTGKLFGVNYTTGGGALTGGNRSTTLGTGIPSAPIVSLKPDGTGADMFITVSGGGGIDAKTISPDANLNLPSNMSNMIYWRDRRVQ